MLIFDPITTKDLRNNLAEILEQVAIGKKSFVVSKFGKKKALIVPADKTKHALYKPLQTTGSPKLEAEKWLTRTHADLDKFHARLKQITPRRKSSLKIIREFRDKKTSV